jgi:hypothetical protein
MSSKLHESALDLVRNRPPSLTLAQIAEGAGVSLDWLKSYATGRVASPGVDNVEKVWTFLSGKELGL